MRVICGQNFFSGVSQLYHYHLFAVKIWMNWTIRRSLNCEVLLKYLSTRFIQAPFHRLSPSDWQKSLLSSSWQCFAITLQWDKNYWSVIHSNKSNPHSHLPKHQIGGKIRDRISYPLLTARQQKCFIGMYMYVITTQFNGKIWSPVYD